MPMQLLQINSSARPGRAGLEPHGSRTRSLTDRFVRRWQQRQPGACVAVRDVGAQPPAPIDATWIRAAFTPAEARDIELRGALAPSDALIAELRRADVVVFGVPMYNFGMPASLKAWIDNIVRIGETFDFDTGLADPYIPLLADRPRRAIMLASRGGHGFDAGSAMAHLNHADPHLRTALAFIGITDVELIAIEHEEHGGVLLEASVAQANAAVDTLVDAMTAQTLAA